MRVAGCTRFLTFAYLALCATVKLATCAGQGSTGMDWKGSVRDTAGHEVAGAEVVLELKGHRYTALSSDAGAFGFAEISPGEYRLSVRWNDRRYAALAPVALPFLGIHTLILGPNGIVRIGILAKPETFGGATLTGASVAAIPLNKRDFSQLLLLAAGTMTDSNGTTNFTQQFAVNGQRGVEAVFAMDGADISDPELGGATLSNFNVDAVQEIQSSSGWMPANIGRGAAGFTNIVTRSGGDSLHGSLFEFVRNSALDARNFFDRQTPENPGRIPPFRRNEFGVTLGGPLNIPKKNEESNTFFFVEYQGFRQVLGTTQVLPVPTAAERSGIDTTAFPGDTLVVPVNPAIAAILRRYPLPNDPTGSFGERTFAASSKVVTDADQFSIRVDHRISSKDHLFARFTWDDLKGPTTNPDQTAIDPAFGITYIDHQRNAAVSWSRTPSATFSSESALSFTRTTPNFPTPDHTDPSIIFGDGLYEAFDAAGGSVTASLGNLFEGRENLTWTRSRHTIQAGGEFRANRDTTYFGTAPNGQYVFGGGAAFATAPVASLSGLHNVAVGQQLPDTLTAFLLGSAFSYSVAVAPPGSPQGDQIGVAAVSRYGLNLYFQDSWKISTHVVLDYGLRFEIYSPISERARRTAGTRFVNGPSGPEQEYLINPEPVYRWRGNNWGPRVRVNWQAMNGFWIRAGGALTTIPPNIWQDNLLTGAAPYVDYPRITAASGSPLSIGTEITPAELPGVYTPAGANILASGNSKAVPVNTVWDVDRFEQSLAAVTSSHQISPLNVNSISENFHNAYLGTWSLNLEKIIRGVNVSAGYIGTAGISLPAMDFPNAFPGATPAFARYTRFDGSGHITGGFGTDMLVTNRSHSTYHALQSSLQGTLWSGGPQVQANFTWAKSLDDDSTVIGPGVGSTSGASALAWPQDPFNTRLEKGPSTFDIGRVFTATVDQELHADRVRLLHFVSSKLTSGWQILSISTLSSGAPFTVYSGVQQTGVGSMGADRPDQIGSPNLSTSRTTREDYFGRGSGNATFFSIPIEIVGGTGPNSGRFGTLGRDTFRGPALYNFDFALIKDTEWASDRLGKTVNFQFRAELFNLFNIVNFGLPSNVIDGSGFGIISRTASNSRQVQFSLKTMF